MSKLKLINSFLVGMQRKTIGEINETYITFNHVSYTAAQTTVHVVSDGFKPAVSQINPLLKDLVVHSTPPL